MNEAEFEQARAIAEQFKLDGKIATVTPFGSGRINDTFLVATTNGERYVLQRVNPMFALTVLDDIEAITKNMGEQNILTAKLIRTGDGKLGITAKGEFWRMLSYIPGRTIENDITGEEARSAMELIGNFHQAFAEHDYAFRHVREGFHDTVSIMAGLEKTAEDYRGTKKGEALAENGAAILREYHARDHAWAHLPKRIIHGDLKLNNIRFDENSPRAIALIDLDTFGRHSVVVDIADAARSWCNRADEGDEASAAFDLEIFRAMMEGYARKAMFLTDTERVAVPGAIAQITLELAARFLADAYHESYFKLDREHYPDLFTQNSRKAAAQFALYRDIAIKLADIAKQVQNID